jgi:hypothetical protein
MGRGDGSGKVITEGSRKRAAPFRKNVLESAIHFRKRDDLGSG